MITTAITGAITAVLAFFGISPAPQLVAGIWIAVKILMVAAVFLVGLRWAKKKSAGGGEVEAEAPSRSPSSTE